MSRVLQRSAVGLLGAWLLLLSGLVYPQLVAHASEHAHHAVGTHATALCTWLCAAGETAEPVVPPSLLALAVASPTWCPQCVQPSSSYDIVNASRGPPAESFLL